MPYAQINGIRIHYEATGAPPRFSRALARRIRRARLAVLPGVHGFFIEHANAFNRSVLRFLRGVRAR